MALEAVPFAVTKDQVLDGRLMLTQPRDGYRVAIDPILLAAAVPALGGERVLDLGCGIGTAALCVAKRVVDVAVTGIDIQPDLVALARRNADENGLAARAAFEVSDVLALGDGSFDHVCANPPYLEAGKSSLSPNPIKAIANVEGAAKLADWVRAAISAVRECGSVTFIHRARRRITRGDGGGPRGSPGIAAAAKGKCGGEKGVDPGDERRHFRPRDIAGHGTARRVGRFYTGGAGDPAQYGAAIPSALTGYPARPT